MDSSQVFHGRRSGNWGTTRSEFWMANPSGETLTFAKAFPIGIKKKNKTSQSFSMKSETLHKIAIIMHWGQDTHQSCGGPKFNFPLCLIRPVLRTQSSTCQVSDLITRLFASVIFRFPHGRSSTLPNGVGILVFFYPEIPPCTRSLIKSGMFSWKGLVSMKWHFLLENHFIDKNHQHLYPSLFVLNNMTITSVKSIKEKTA